MPKPTKEMLKRAEKLVEQFIEGKMSASELIDGILSSVDEGLVEKVSYAHDIRLGQNRETGPVNVEEPTGKYRVRQAHNRVKSGE